MKEEPKLFKWPSSTGEHEVLLLTYKYFQCTCFNFLFINWKECGAIKGILKKSIQSILYITRKSKWIYLRFVFQLHIYWSELFCKLLGMVICPLISFFFILLPSNPTVRIKSVFNEIKFRILGGGGGKYRLCETWLKFTTFLHLITVFGIILSLCLYVIQAIIVWSAIPILNINTNYISINTQPPPNLNQNTYYNHGTCNRKSFFFTFSAIYSKTVRYL